MSEQPGLKREGTMAVTAQVNSATNWIIKHGEMVKLEALI